MTTIGIITPVKNESENLSRLIESIEAQTIEPRAWVIVDDSSTDGSTEIIADAVSDTEWIHSKSNESDDGYQMRENYAKVLSVGYEFLHDNLETTFDYYMILDADMRLTPNYLEELVQFLESYDELVISSTAIYYDSEHGIVREDQTSNHPAGGATLYDGEFYRNIGGPAIVPGVDSVTETRARVSGYEARMLVDTDEQAIQTRQTGHKGNRWRNAMMRGQNYYFVGMPLSVVVMNSLWRTTKPPFYTGIGFFAGYLTHMLRRAPKIDDDDVIQYNRNERPKQILTTVVSRFRSKGLW